jgi:hypothetical protein
LMLLPFNSIDDLTSEFIKTMGIEKWIHSTRI